MKFILGKKIEMTQQYREDGSVVPVTLVQADPCCVTQIKTQENEGYQSVQVASGEKRHISKPQMGHFKQQGNFSFLREFRVSDVSKISIGDKITVAVFEVGDHIDVVGISKGRGFAGVVKRHHFGGSPKTHGHKDQLRMPGSLGSRRQGPVAKGQRMGGRMGVDQVTVKNLEIISVDSDRHILAIKGAIPGPKSAPILLWSQNEGWTGGASDRA